MEVLIGYAMSFVGIPYIYGGNNPLVGLDCSGLTCELLKSTGALGTSEDLSAQQIFDRFQQNGRWNQYGPGVLVFYGKSVSQIDHVAVMVDSNRVIEAGHGSPEITTVEKAKEAGAFVRIRSVKYRKDMVALIRPPMPQIGMP